MSDTINTNTEQTPEVTTPETTSTQPQQQQEQVNYKELYMRLAADLQNFKRRVEKERTDWTETAQGMIVSAFLPIFEDFDRAIESTTLAPEALEGFKLIQKNIKKTMNDLGINEIEATGEFNPEYHEALTQIESPDHTTGAIVQILSKGYMFKSKVLKHAQVSVAK